jgi:hypothetical protein
MGARLTLTNIADSEFTVRIISPLSSEELMPPSRENLKNNGLERDNICVEGEL